MDGPVEGVDERSGSQRRVEKATQRARPTRRQVEKSESEEPSLEHVVQGDDRGEEPVRVRSEVGTHRGSLQRWDEAGKSGFIYGFLVGHNILVRLALLGGFKDLLHPDT